MIFNLDTISQNYILNNFNLVAFSFLHLWIYMGEVSIKTTFLSVIDSKISNMCQLILNCRNNVRIISGLIIYYFVQLQLNMPDLLKNLYIFGNI